MVLPPNPPLTKHGKGKCEHENVKFKKIAKTAVEGFCARCNETLGIIIVDPNPARIDAYVSIRLKREDGVKLISGKPRKLTIKERRELA